MKKVLFILCTMLLGLSSVFSQITPPFSQGFEDENIYQSEGWGLWYDSQDTSNLAGFGLFYDNVYVYAHTGYGCFLFSSYEELSDYEYGQYLVSPKLNTGGNSLTLSFYYADLGESPETFRVGYTTDPTVTGNFTNYTWFSTVTTPGDGIYYNYTVTLPATATYFVIEYTSYWAYYLFVDDINLTVSGGGGTCGTVDMGIAHSDDTYFNVLTTTTVNYGDDLPSYFLIYNSMYSPDTYNDSFSIDWSINGTSKGTLGSASISLVPDSIDSWFYVPLLTAADITAANLWGTTATICYDLILPACWTETNPADNTACMTVTFAPAQQGNSYVISASAGVGGSISPAGNTTVAEGASQTYTFMPNSCYQIADVKVDGVSVGALPSYTFSNVLTNHTIAVTFVQIIYNVTVTVGAGGTVSYNSVTLNPGTQTITVNCGDSPNFIFTPDAGNTVNDVIVNGSSVGSLPSYTIPGVSSDMTLQVSFNQGNVSSYVISASAGAGGTISPSGNTNVAEGGSQTYNFTPDACYKIADVQVDGASIGALSSYTFSNVLANHTISVTFVQTTYNVSITVGAGGTASYNGTVMSPGTQTITVNCGDNVHFVFTPNAGNSVSDVLVNGSSVGGLLTYTMTGISSDMSLQVTFAQQGNGGDNGGGTSIAQFAGAQFQLYPNPVANDLEIVAQYPIEKIEIMNLLGEKVKEIAVSGEKVRINVADLSAGLYAIRLFGDTHVSTKKFVKE